jgi:hypothetical protein
MTRQQMKALPVLQIVARYARVGELTVLAFEQHTPHISRLYGLLPDLSRHYRGVIEIPLRAHFAEKHIRSVWARLVDRSIGYYLNGRGLQQYTDA